MFQRRRFPRLNKEYRLSYRQIDAEQFKQDPISSLAVNISGGGICFEASEALPKGSMVTLEINAPDFRSPILALARVAWCKAKGNHYEVGAEFWWIGWRDSHAQSAIAEYVATHTLGQEAVA